jgi:hypothetical protein
MAYAFSKYLRRYVSDSLKRELEEHFVILNVSDGNILLASYGFSGYDLSQCHFSALKFSPNRIEDCG